MLTEKHPYCASLNVLPIICIALKTHISQSFLKIHTELILIRKHPVICNNLFFLSFFCPKMFGNWFLSAYDFTIDSTSSESSLSLGQQHPVWCYNSGTGLSGVYHQMQCYPDIEGKCASVNIPPNNLSSVVWHEDHFVLKLKHSACCSVSKQRRGNCRHLLHSFKNRNLGLLDWSYLPKLFWDGFFLYLYIYEKSLRIHQ